MIVMTIDFGRRWRSRFDAEDVYVQMVTDLDADFARVPHHVYQRPHLSPFITADIRLSVRASTNGSQGEIGQVCTGSGHRMRKFN